MEPCEDGKHRWGHSRPVHYNDGNSTNHVRACLDCGWHGVVIRYSNRNSKLCPLKPSDYDQPLGLAIREDERAREQCRDLFTHDFL